MARKDVNIGLTGNDGTGDSIRDAFSKVNANFQELYASQGLEAGLTFDNLVDVIKPLRPNTVLGLDSLGKTIVSRDLEAAVGISIDTVSDPSKIIFSIANVQIRQDPTPTLSNVLDGSGFKLSFIGDPENDQDAVTRKWVYQNFLNRDNIDKLGTFDLAAGSVMRQNFKISPTPDNGNINAGTKIINVFGSDGVTPKTDVQLKFQATHPAHATRKDYVDTKLSLQGTETLDPATGFVNKGMGVMTGPLILNDHPGQYVEIDRKPDGTLFVQEDYRAATRGYVDSKTYSAAGNIFVSTKGNDDMWDFDNNRPNPIYGYPEEEIGRSWSKAFKSVNAACRYATRIIDAVELQNIPYQVTPQQISRWAPPFTTPITSPRTRVRVSLQNHGFKDGDYVLVSGAILGSLDTRNLNGIHRVNALDVNNFELNLKSLVTWPNPEVAPGGTISISLANKKDGPYSEISKVDFGFRGFFVPKPEITIMVESGVYFEEAPMFVPPNCAIKGDEFRRTLIKPKPGPVNPDNQLTKFVRGDRSQSATFWYNSHYYNQLSRSVGTTNVVGSTKLEIKNSPYRPKSGMRFIVGTLGGIPNVYRVGREVNIVYKEPNPDLNIAPGTYIMDIVDDNGDPKPLATGIPDSTTIEFLLDHEHCDAMLVADAFQLRNITVIGFKGFAMAFDPKRQIKTRSPYAQVGAVFAGEGGGGQLVDGMSGNQVCYVLDTSYTDPFTGTQGSSGLKMTVTGLVRTPETPNTFFLAKKKYVIIDSTTPDSNGTATLTLSTTTPIEVDDTYLPAGFIPNGSQILIETAGNRSMLSNDFTMINDLGYGLVCENNGVAEAVSQFTYYCRASYLSRSGGQIRSVTGSSCYGIIGLQSEGSDPNEAIQIGRIKTDIGNIMQVYIDDPSADGNQGAVSLVMGGLASKPIRNSTFKLTKHEIIIKNIARARLSGGTLTTGPLVVTTYYPHPFSTGESVQMTSVRGLQLPAIPPSTTPRATDVDGRVYTITSVNSHTFTLDGSESTNYINDLGTYNFADLPARAISNLVIGAQDVVFSIKGDPSPSNITGRARFDGIPGENQAGQNVLKLQRLQRPAVVGMKTTIPGGVLTYTVTDVTEKVVTFKPSPRPAPTGDNDNKIGAQTIYIYTTTDITTGAINGTTLTATNLDQNNVGQLVTGATVADNTYIIAVTSPTTATVSISQTVTNRTLELSWVPKIGWSFQHLDTNMGLQLNYTRYTITDTPVYDAVSNRWAVTLDVPLTVNMQNQEATGQTTIVDGIWDVTLNYDLETSIANSVNPVSFTFVDSYWVTSIDPSLTNPIPTVTDEYNRVRARKINLYQQKTISVSQILNRPAIINSSALRFSSSNYDPSIYRILGKTSDGGITQDRYAVTTTINPLSGLNTNAVEKVLANKTWIQSEVINYLATIYPNFQYNVNTCYRDVGYIIDAVLYDLTYGGNVRSRAAGISYYQQGNPSAALVLSQQKVETIDAINFATTAAITALNQYSGATVPQLQLPYRGSNLNGVAQLQANKLFIQDEVIAFLAQTYPTLQFNQTTCRRDVGLIIDAVAYDLEYGGNVATRTAALAYYDGSTSSQYVLSNQKTQTIAAINRASTVAQQIVLETAVTATAGNTATQNTAGTPGVAGVDDVRVQTLMNIITNVLQNGTSVAPTRNLGIRRSYQDPLGVEYAPQSIDSGIVAEAGAATALQALMDQIVAIIEFGTTGPHVVVQPQVLDTLQAIDFPPTATSLQYGAVLTGPGIPKAGVNGVTEDTFIRTVTQLFDENQNTIGYRARISAPVTQAIPAGTEIVITGPGSDFLFDLNTPLDLRHLAGDVIGITTTFSTVRATGHDFLNVGAGGYDDSNYPNNVYGQPVNTPSDSAIAKEVGTGRVFHVSTDQNGNFRVGSFFNVNQGDGSVSISAKIGLSAVTSLSFLTGATVNQFSTDSKLDDNSDNIVSTQKAMKTYINNLIDGRFTIDNTDTPQRGLLRLDGESIMVGDLDVGLNSVERIVNSPNNDGSVNRKYVDNVFAGGSIDYDGSYAIETTGRRTDVLAFTMITDNTSVGGVPNNRGGIDLNDNKIQRLKSPTELTDAANRAYVDQTIATGGVRLGWTGFTLSNTNIRNTVSSISMVNNGGGYLVPPAVVLYSTSGTGAAARAVLTAGTGARSVNNIIVDIGGYGYTEAPIVIIGGSVSNVNVNNSGTGYSSAPTLTFSAPPVGGIRATGYAVMQGSGSNQIISSIVITNAGVGYTLAPTIALSGGGSPTVNAIITAVLQAGSGATATASITATQRNIDLNGNKVTGSADPTQNTDLVTLNYFNTKNFIGEIADVTITNVPGSGDLLVFTGTVPAGSKGAMVNVAVDSSSDISFVRSANTITVNIKDNAIIDSNIAPNAAIQQTKLLLNRANAVVEGAGAGVGDFGIVAVNSAEFISDSGLIKLRQSENKNTGVRLDRMQQITNYRILGRYNSTESETSVGPVTEVPVGDLKQLLGLSAATVQVLISDDILGGRQVDSGNPLSPLLATNWNGSASFGALLRRGGTMIGKIVMTDAGGLPAGDPNITPIIGVGAGLTDKLDIGTSALRFQSVYAKNHFGDVFRGTTFGSATAPTSQGGGAIFNGTATFAGSSGALQYALVTPVGGDLALRVGANNVTFNGSQEVTISVLAETGTVNNSLVRRTSDGQINASQFNGPLTGLATSATNLRLGTTDYPASDSASSTSVPLRINGVIKATTFEGKATSANYADLAENYQADFAYEPGTVLEFGGAYEVTIAQDETRKVAGVVSTNPAHLMNTELQGENVVALALQGRVPCKVRGKISKGDLMTSAGGGYARPTHDPKIGTIIGKALEDFDGVEGVIEVVVGRL